MCEMIWEKSVINKYFRIKAHAAPLYFLPSFVKFDDDILCQSVLFSEHPWWRQLQAVLRRLFKCCWIVTQAYLSRIKMVWRLLTGQRNAETNGKFEKFNCYLLSLGCGAKRLLSRLKGRIFNVCSFWIQFNASVCLSKKQRKIIHANGGTKAQALDN